MDELRKYVYFWEDGEKMNWSSDGLCIIRVPSLKTTEPVG